MFQDAAKRRVERRVILDSLSLDAYNYWGCNLQRYVNTPRRKFCDAAAKLKLSFAKKVIPGYRNLDQQPAVLLLLLHFRLHDCWGNGHEIPAARLKFN